MRVIRTEIYFHRAEVQLFEGAHQSDRADLAMPGVAFLWFGGELEPNLGFDECEGLEHIPDREFRKQEAEEVLDRFLRDGRSGEFQQPPGGSIANGKLVSQLMDADIVIERSPPISVTLRGVLNTQNTPIWIGAFVGAYAAIDHPVLMLLTVPGGIMGVGSAAAVSIAMQTGLNRVIRRMFEKPF